MMTVNGLILPASFERLIRRPDARMRSWLPRENLDAYGNEWSTFPLELFTDPETIAERTAWLPGNERLASETPEQIAKRNTASAALPGSIPWITDFSRILQFGHNNTGEAYCFDFRDDPQKPSVIFMDGWYWRRVAPDFDALLGILEPYNGQDLDEREQEIERRRHPEADPEETEKEAGPAWAHVPVKLLASGPEPIIVNGLVLPAAFQAFIRGYPAQVWHLKENFGQPLRVQFQPYETREQIVTAAAQWAQTFRRLLDISTADPQRDRPGYLPLITDYSQIIPFGYCRRGLPFSFDFREDPQQPSVIYLPQFGVHWRRVAPNFQTFLCLLEGYDVTAGVKMLKTPE